MGELQAYIREGEHQTQDFKFRVDDPKKIARTLVAFANTDGGRLLIGVKDNGKVTGIDPEEEFHIIDGAASLYCQPKITFTSKVWQEDHKLVLEIIVAPSPLKPHKAKDDENRWRAYVRRDDHTLLANKILLGIWRLATKKIERPQEFNDEQMSLLRLLRDNPKVTISRMYRILPLTKNQIDQLLVLLVTWGVIEMHITKEGTFYQLAEDVEKS